MLTLLPANAIAQGAPPTELPTVEVVGTTPLPGTGIDRDKLPANVQSVGAADITRAGTPGLLNALTDRVGSISPSSTLGDPFQPDIAFRGFKASPVLGTPQGLAVYQNGVRINEAFGDTVNWDLIPDIAIDRIDLMGSNPVYGLNALGGAAVITMKNGFTYQGFESELTGGSFGQRTAALQYGVQSDGYAAYLAGRKFDSDGWRKFSPDHTQQLYADIGTRSDRASLDFSFTGADNRLYGQGTAPVQELAVDRTLDFTTPQSNFNRLAFFTVNGSYQVSDSWLVEANAYYRMFRQSVINGNTTNVTACASGNRLLCQSDGMTPLTAANGAGIPDLSNGGTVPIGENDRESISATGTGGTVQTSYTGALFNRDNNLVFGSTFDHSTVSFGSSAEVGVINSALQVAPSGFFVATPENSGFNATPVSLNATNNYYGVFVTDTFNLTPALALTASGRYNLAEIALTDRLGSNLTGDNRYSRFNPAIGASYKIAAGMTAYAGYSEANRAPTPSELECANPTQPCLLPSSLSSDPHLRQVVAHTYETGLRGNFTLPVLVPGRFGWNVGLFRSDLSDDIYGVATSLTTAVFENIGGTRRQGIETGLTYKDDTWSLYGSYSLVDATFRSSLVIPSPSNPFADANGNIHVAPGDRLPEIPEHQLKVGADYRVMPGLTIGGVLAYFGDQYLRGDESNQLGPLPGYAVVNLHGTYTVTPHVELFANLTNALNARYATFGQLGDPTGVGAPGVPATGAGVDNRFVSPAPPIAAFGGLRVRF